MHGIMFQRLAMYQGKLYLQLFTVDPQPPDNSNEQ